MCKKKLSMIILFPLFLAVFYFGGSVNSSKVYAENDVGKDVPPSHWAHSSINHMITKKYMSKYADGMFKPEQLITRAEAAAAIARSLEIVLETTISPDFRDVPITHPYYKEIYTLVALGVIQNSDTFYPEAPLKRMQIAKMIALAYKIEVDAKNKSEFKDVPSSHWAKDMIESLADVSIIKGVDANHFKPNQNVTRAQLAVLVERALDFTQKVKKLEVAYDYLSKDYIPTVNFSTTWSQEVIRLINNERQKNKLSAFTHDASLTQIAVIKAQDMVNRGYFDHVSPFYGAPWDLATLFDYTYTSFGENIGRNIPSPEAAVKAWMASPPHRENIVKENFTNTGVGVAKSNEGKYYWVQMFSSQ